MLVDGVCEPEPEAAEEAPLTLAAREATAWRRADVSCGFGVCGVTGVVAAGVAPVGRRNMASMVGRREAPNGVERKSAGRSRGIVRKLMTMNIYMTTIPLIHEGMDWPVRKPMQSFVKELQLKSNPR